MLQMSYLLPLALGVTVVFQATLNRSMASHYGLASAVTLNAAVFFALSLGIFVFAKYNPDLVPDFLQIRRPENQFSWTYLLPGVCGFILVMGLPWSIELIGPSASFLLLISSQILVSLILEATQSPGPLSFPKLVGGFLVLAGSILVMKS
jgi:transporter family-2 protein